MPETGAMRLGDRPIAEFTDTEIAEAMRAEVEATFAGRGESLETLCFRMGLLRAAVEEQLRRLRRRGVAG